jgi:hypothetical protein
MPTGLISRQDYAGSRHRPDDLFHILPGSKSEFCPMMLGLVDDVPLDLLKLTCGQSEKTAVIMKLRPPRVRYRRDLCSTTG